MKLRNLNLPTAEVEAFCQRWKISELSLFGSVLRDDFRQDSDLDVLVTFAEDAIWSLFEIFDAQEELARILGRKVDLVERKAVEESPNYIRRKHILRTVQLVYVTSSCQRVGHADREEEAIDPKSRCGRGCSNSTVTGSAVDGVWGDERSEPFA